jgi:hypothetical protein
MRRWRRRKWIGYESTSTISAADSGGTPRRVRRQAARPAHHTETVDTDARIDWDGTPFTFAIFTWEFVQHEALHHGQWSIYASLAGF